ncbi:MAG: hypothetical protein LBL66_03820 [Clostridiales bacterium]|jgi:hypothetical protein|nr:hypothetical protein [Clostridiales bacterium]
MIMYDEKEILSSETEGYNADTANGELRKRELLRAADNSVYSVITKPVFTLARGVSLAAGDNPLVKHFLGVTPLPPAAVYGGYVSAGDADGSLLEVTAAADADSATFTVYYPLGTERATLTADNIPLLHIDGLPDDKRRAVVRVKINPAS